MILELLSLRLNLNWSVAAAAFWRSPSGHRSSHRGEKALILRIARKKLSLRLRSETNSSLQKSFSAFFLVAEKEEKEKID